jgi:hypothetical protein
MNPDRSCQETDKRKFEKMKPELNNQIFKAMKKIIFLVLLTIAFGSATYARERVAEGKTYSALGDYKIEKADKPVVINGEELKAFVISYQNSPMEVTVVIQKGKKCKNYIVLSDKLSIQYVCNENYFGVTKLDKTLRIEGFTPTEEALNNFEYYHQKVLAPGMRGELENAQLIAAFFPMLLNPS